HRLRSGSRCGFRLERQLDLAAAGGNLRVGDRNARRQILEFNLNRIREPAQSLGTQFELRFASPIDREGVGRDVQAKIAASGGGGDPQPIGERLASARYEPIGDLDQICPILRKRKLQKRISLVASDIVRPGQLLPGRIRERKHGVEWGTESSGTEIELQERPL